MVIREGVIGNKAEVLLSGLVDDEGVLVVGEGTRVPLREIPGFGFRLAPEVDW